MDEEPPTKKPRYENSNAEFSFNSRPLTISNSNIRPIRQVTEQEQIQYNNEQYNQQGNVRVPNNQ